MSEINLLQPEQVTASSIIGRGKYYFAKLLMLAILILLLGYGYLLFDDSHTSITITSTQAKMAQAQSDALSNKNRAELITRQGQIKELNGLIKNHLYWSYILPELARVTLKSAKYTGIEADATGKLSLTATLPNYSELEKFLQIFDLPEYNQEFSNVKVVSITKAQQGESGSIETSVKLQLIFNPSYIKGRL